MSESKPQLFLWNFYWMPGFLFNSENIYKKNYSILEYSQRLLKIQSLINAFCLLRELFLFFTSSRNVNSFKSRDREKFLHLNIVSSPVFYLLPLVQMQLQIYTGKLDKTFLLIESITFLQEFCPFVAFHLKLLRSTQKMCNPLPGT